MKISNIRLTDSYDLKKKQKKNTLYVKFDICQKIASHLKLRALTVRFIVHVYQSQHVLRTFAAMHPDLSQYSELRCPPQLRILTLSIWVHPGVYPGMRWGVPFIRGDFVHFSCWVLQSFQIISSENFSDSTICYLNVDQSFYSKF